MSERPPHDPYPTEADRQRIIAVWLAILAAAVIGAAVDLYLWS